MKQYSWYLIAAAVLAGVLATAATATATSAKAHRTAALTIVVKSDSEHAKKGPDGKWHDAFLPADFSLTAGQETTIVFVNYDESAHSLVSPSLRLMVRIPAAKGSTPGRATISFTAPKAGRYDWWCGNPCDPWAMMHDGFMRGYITVTG